MDVGTDERPKVRVGPAKSDPDEAALLSAEGLSRRLTFVAIWPWVALVVGLAGFAVGLVSLLK